MSATAQDAIMPETCLFEDEQKVVYGMTVKRPNGDGYDAYVPAGSVVPIPLHGGGEATLDTLLANVNVYCIVDMRCSQPTSYLLALTDPYSGPRLKYETLYVPFEQIEQPNALSWAEVKSLMRDYNAIMITNSAQAAGKDFAGRVVIYNLAALRGIRSQH